MNKAYPHIMTLCAFLLMFVNVGFPSTSFGVYQPYIVEAPGMSHAYGSIVVSIRCLSSLITMFFVAIWYKKLDCRIGISVATLITACGFLIFSFANGPGLYIAASVVTGIGYSLGGASGMTLLLDNWFGKKSSVALGIATSGSSLSGIFLPSIVLAVLSASSLGMSFLLQAILAFIIAAILFILIRNNPDSSKENKEKKKIVFRPGIRYLVLGPVKYWLFVFAVFLIGGIAITGVNFLSILFSTAGSSAEVAAAVVVTSSISLCISKLIIGFVYKKLGTFWGTILFWIVLTIGSVMLCFAPGKGDVLAYVSSCVFVFGASISTVGLAKWSIALANHESREFVIRDMQVAYIGGGFIFGLLPGFLAEIFNTYVIFYAGVVFMCIVFGIIYVCVYPKK